MPASKITDLLPIPPGTRQPHPYQVFGLEDGEQNPAVIDAAVQSIVSQLKAVKSQTEPNLWKQAARLVKGAREILLDREKKAQLDARFGIVSLDSIAESTGSSSDALAAFLPASDPLTPASDPLASVLPTADPLTPATPIVPADSSQPEPQVPSPEAATSPVIVPDTAAVNAMPPGLFGTPAASGEAEPVSPSVGGVVVDAPRTRRKQSKMGTYLFLAFAFATFGIIGSLVYFLIFGPGQVAITQADGRISISTQSPPDNPPTVVSQPRPIDSDPVEETPPRDPIMGDLVPSERPRGPLTQPSGLTRSLNVDFDGGVGPAEPNAIGAPEIAMDSLPNIEPVEVGAMLVDMQASPDPEMEPMTEEMIAEADQKIQRLGDLIRAANWKEMRSAAEAAIEQRMTDDQTQRAQALFEVADLATYYRTGIEQAIANLKVGNDFEVTKDVRVIVVETGEDLLVVRLNARNRSYTIDRLPWSLAHKLASFTMAGDDPTVQAAAAVYQAVSPNSNEEYRDQALQLLVEMQGEVEGADLQRVVETIRSLFVET